MKITMLVGLPCSGKTHYGKGSGCLFIDDVSLMDTKVLKEMIKDMNIIIADVFLCRPRERTSAQRWFDLNFPDAQLEWVFFENNREKCLTNMRHHRSLGDDRKVEDLIHVLSKDYVIPYGTKTLEIWQPKAISLGS